MKLKPSGYTNYNKTYRLVWNRRMSTFTMVSWFYPSLKHVEICYNVKVSLKRFIKHVEIKYNV